MTKLEQLKLALSARKVAKNGAEWEGYNAKVRELIHELTPAFLELADAAQDVIDAWEHGDLAGAVRTLDICLGELK